ncbi:SMI1/KNR4 family protein [Streptomyces sp. NPDC001941]|uniref:SMI1/KNR4 family protein n=1 Tax=Streptomyces sp. NPDC001941 TaxID=3154659 RepID=UPI00332AA32E
MDDQQSPSLPIHAFATWESVLRFLRASHRDRLAVPGARVTGFVGRGGWSVPIGHGRDERDAVERVRGALLNDGIEVVSFAVEIEPAGRAVLHILEHGPAVEHSAGPHPGALVLAEGALPAPWHRLPDQAPGAAPAASVDPALLERRLRERLPDAVGATEAEIVSAETRLGMALPDELKVLYRVTRAKWEDWRGDYEAVRRHSEAVRCELFDLESLYVAEAATRECLWQFGARETVDIRPGAVVQGVVGSAGWIVFGDNGGGDRLAVDLTPGPRGHAGQVILLSHEQSVGAALVADSLTDLVLGRPGAESGLGEDQRPPAVAYVNTSGLRNLETAIHSGLEVLSIRSGDGPPFSLASLMGLPRLRTLIACPGTIADPREIAGLTGLEYLELGAQDWRVLLDAKAVPRGLSAAFIKVDDDEDPLPVVDLANELLTLWDRPAIIRTVVSGDLGPAA